MENESVEAVAIATSDSRKEEGLHTVDSCIHEAHGYIFLHTALLISNGKRKARHAIRGDTIDAFIKDTSPAPPVEPEEPL